jgi:pyruvate/2-oxoglutarate dehydrogenase complex dihydrolipoamide acyltransferase (E2) component
MHSCFLRLSLPPPPAPASILSDPSQWGELFNDLRNWSTGSGQPPSLTGRNSFTTDWIPELLSMKASGRLDQDAAAAAPAGGPAGVQQQQQEAGPVAAAAAAAAAAAEGGCDVEGGVVEGGKGRSKGKRERSKTNQAPTEQQKQEWQVGEWAGGWVDECMCCCGGVGGVPACWVCGDSYVAGGCCP